MPSVLVDTGVWYALCDFRDTVAPRDRIEEIYDRIRLHDVLIPWPIAYETLRTRLVRNRLAMARFEQELKSPRVVLLDDAPYREEAIELSFESSLRRGRPLSMVDCLLRLLIDDVRVRMKFLATFNPRDFHDVCARRGIELWG